MYSSKEEEALRESDDEDEEDEPLAGTKFTSTELLSVWAREGGLPSPNTTSSSYMSSLCCRIV